MGEPNTGGKQSVVLREAIEKDGVLDSLQKRTRILAWKSGLAQTHDQLAELAEEVLQEALLRVLTKGDSYDPARAVQAWVMAFVARVLLERQRERQRERKRVVISRSAENSTEGSSAIEQIVDLSAHDRARLEELLDLVGPAERHVLTLRFVQGLEGREIAAALGVKEGAARVRLSRAVNRLAQAYRQAERAGLEER